MSIENEAERPRLLLGPISENGSANFYRTDADLFGTIEAGHDDDLQPQAKIALELRSGGDLEVEVDVSPLGQADFTVSKALSKLANGQDIEYIT